jgi:hypothetical protein
MLLGTSEKTELVDVLRHHDSVTDPGLELAGQPT